MSRKRTAELIVAALLGAALLLPGCVKPTITPQTTKPVGATPSGAASTPVQSSVEPSATSPVNATGPITTPPAGSAERKALLDAARAKLGTTTSFYVYQLYVQGDTALGDLDPTATSKIGRVFVAWTKENGAWVAIGATRFGATAASEASTARALPSFSAALIHKIDWTLAKPKLSTTASSATSGLSSAAKAWAKTAMDGAGSPYKVTVLKVAQDKSGTWWGHAVVQPTGNSTTKYEALNMWAKYAGGKWTGNVQDPEPPAPSTYFPKEVISKLGPL